jgi:hypothetical protein
MGIYTKGIIEKNELSKKLNTPKTKCQQNKDATYKIDKQKSKNQQIEENWDNDSKNKTVKEPKAHQLSSKRIP